MEYSVLIVEDQEQFYVPMRRWVEDLGCTCLIATSLEESMQVLGVHKFQAAIIDISLVHDDPTDQGGLTLIEWIIEKEIGIKLAVCTANVNIDSLLRLTQELKVTAYIQKSPGYRKKFRAFIESHVLRIE